MEILSEKTRFVVSEKKRKSRDNQVKEFIVYGLPQMFVSKVGWAHTSSPQSLFLCYVLEVQFGTLRNI